MKHLKTYKLFESSLVNDSEIREYLQDIFLDLQDNGYHIRVNRLMEVIPFEHDITQIGFTLDIHHYENFNILDVLDPLEHAIEYMKDNGYLYNIDATFRYNVSKSDHRSRWTYDENNIQLEDIRKNSRYKIIKVRVTFKSNQ